MSGTVLKKCFNCRTDLENSNGGTQCAKCKKNEEKYGQATTCQYCQLNAAFRDRQCVWCASSIRRLGNPIHCANCQLNCAFPKSEKIRKAGTKQLCRLCYMQAVQTKQSVLAGVPVNLDKEKERKENREKDAHKKSQKRKKEETAEETPVKQIRPATHFGVIGGVDSLAENESQMKIQKLSDEISRLKTVLQTKDTQMMEKEKLINSLKADIYNQDKKHREKIAKMEKEKEETLRYVENIQKKSKK